jgi:aspartyl-tRNA(Asn)/glutamyl-tRNA(Gln) amidotransferase subunit A
MRWRSIVIVNKVSRPERHIIGQAMSTSASDLSELSAIRLAGLISQRQLSAREVVATFLERIETLDPTLGAFVYLDAERALADARWADAQVTGGRELGPLHGVPIGVKDIFNVFGMPTGAGSSIAAAHPDSDAEPVRRLRAAGAILTGKLTTSEFGCGSPFVIRRPRNPWNLDHVAGGSSAGSAIVVGARLLPAAIGGDTGGSVRIPSSFCGIVGLRPSAGMVRTDGAVALAPGIDTAGPMTRSAGDAELLLKVMGSGFEQASVRTVGSVTSIDLTGDPGVDPEVAAATEQVARSAAELLGIALTTVRPTALRIAWAAAWTIIYSQALSVYRDILRDGFRELSPPFRWKLCAAAALDGDDLRAGQRIAEIVKDELSICVRGDAVLVTPTTAHPANRLDGPYRGRDTMEWTAGPSLAGLPALSSPAGLTRDGLPIGVQLIAERGTDLGLLRCATRLEQAGILGKIGRPPIELGAIPMTGANATPVEAPPRVSVTARDLDEVRASASRLDLPPLDAADVDGAARSLRAVRRALHSPPIG